MKIISHIIMLFINVSGVITFSVVFFQVDLTGRALRAVYGQESVTPITADDAVVVDEKRDAIVKSALSLVGTPYRWGGSSPRRGFDCCGFVMYVYSLNRISLPRTSGSQFLNGKYIEMKDAKKGDLLFFNIPRGRISHVGIYIGDGKFVHAPVPGRRVRVERINEIYWQKYFFGAATYLE
jgi:cell wall-associated NlpC family hydrolase